MSRAQRAWVVVNGNDRRKYVVCVCSAEGPEGYTITEAVSLWNRRAGVRLC